MKLVTKQSRGFSLIEMLMAMAIVSMLAAVALVGFMNVNGAAERVKARNNAQAICHLYESAKSVGAVFTSTTKEGILEELIAGKNGRGRFADTVFTLSLADREKREALALCSFDSQKALMNFLPG